MAISNLEFFRAAVEKDPNNTFAQYSLAMEYRKTGALKDALEKFREIIRRDPAYVAAYLMAAQTAIDSDNESVAEEILRAGIETATSQNNSHAAGEMQDLLDSIL
ncbi:MAG TPA: tetratricopeptide repeat protein [Firmicutes bacterium]|nr:tetratricopeptide repeat protein [Bacillota bacterium]